MCLCSSGLSICTHRPESYIKFLVHRAKVDAIKRNFLIAGVLALLILVFVPFFFTYHDDIFLNQFWIQSQALHYGSITAEDFIDTLIFSAYTRGLGNIFGEKAISANFNNPESVFLYVFSRFPRFAVVYPTETYYYYQFNAGNIAYSGNIRLLDADKGIIHIGYFEENHPERGDAMDFNSTNGLHVRTLGTGVYEVSYNGYKRMFKMTDLAEKAPQKLFLLSSEEFIA